MKKSLEIKSPQLSSLNYSGKVEGAGLPPFSGRGSDVGAEVIDGPIHGEHR